MDEKDIARIRRELEAVGFTPDDLTQSGALFGAIAADATRIQHLFTEFPHTQATIYSFCRAITAIGGKRPTSSERDAVVLEMVNAFCDPGKVNAFLDELSPKKKAQPPK